MKISEIITEDISRRGFLKGLGAAAVAGAGLSGAKAAKAANNSDIGVYVGYCWPTNESTEQWFKYIDKETKDGYERQRKLNKDAEQSREQNKNSSKGMSPEERERLDLGIWAARGGIRESVLDEDVVDKFYNYVNSQARPGFGPGETTYYLITVGNKKFIIGSKPIRLTGGDLAAIQISTNIMAMGAKLDVYASQLKQSNLQDSVGVALIPSNISERNILIKNANPIPFKVANGNEGQQYFQKQIDGWLSSQNFQQPTQQPTQQPESQQSKTKRALEIVEKYGDKYPDIADSGHMLKSFLKDKDAPSRYVEAHTDTILQIAKKNNLR